jgi:transcription initiation factor TFIID subunit 6
MENNNSKNLILALDSIGGDPGIQSLLPYFISFVSDTITKELKNVAVLKNMAKMLEALIKNKYLFIDPYVFYC